MPCMQTIHVKQSDELVPVYGVLSHPLATRYVMVCPVLLRYVHWQKHLPPQDVQPWTV